MIVNMSHAAIVNPLADLGPLTFNVSGHNQQAGDEQSQSTLMYQLPQLTGAPPQMPMLKPAPNMKSGKEKNNIGKDLVIKLNSDGKPIKKGELDPSTMVHVPGGNILSKPCLCYVPLVCCATDSTMLLVPSD